MKINHFLKLLLFILVSFCFCGCLTAKKHEDNKKSEKKNMPPPHAKAHGVKKKLYYNYYPAANVYFDIGKKVYFYKEGKNWISVPKLPDSITIDVKDFVQIDMDTDTPYIENETHQKKYSPGSLKKEEKEKKKETKKNKDKSKGKKK